MDPRVFESKCRRLSKLPVSELFFAQLRWAYKRSSEDQRRGFRKMLGYDSADRAKRAGDDGAWTDERPWLANALQAKSSMIDEIVRISQWSDPKKRYEALGPLYYSAILIGLNPDKVLYEAASRCRPEDADMVRRFALRPGKRLKEFGYEAKRLDDKRVVIRKMERAERHAEQRAVVSPPVVPPAVPFVYGVPPARGGGGYRWTAKRIAAKKRKEARDARILAKRIAARARREKKEALILAKRQARKRRQAEREREKERRRKQRQRRRAAKLREKERSEKARSIKQAAAKARAVRAGKRALPSKRPKKAARQAHGGKKKRKR